ncbi:hypothetical protein [Phytohabitans houttuyneae]|nr:hypothetical protein [Phytohabitans houttuyneae]
MAGEVSLWPEEPMPAGVYNSLIGDHHAFGVDRDVADRLRRVEAAAPFWAVAVKSGGPVGCAGCVVTDAARLETPDLHLPVRPAWWCTDDGTPWPCAVYKRRLWATARGRSVKVAERMGRWMALAGPELSGLSERQLRDRFVGWVADGPPPPQVVVMPAQQSGTDPGS